MMPIKQKGSVSARPSLDGFTLIELLVVISIIGLLASVVLVALNGARQKARVTKRVADLSQIQKALELYYDDHNSQYPLSNPGDNPTGNWRTQCAGWFNTTNVIPGLTPTYVSSLPTDPAMKASTNENCYLYLSDGTGYKFLDYNLTDMTLAQINNFSNYKDPQRNGGSTACPGSSEATLSFAIYSQDKMCW